MASNGGVMPNKEGAAGKGFDDDVARTFANRLGLNLHVTWFESEDKEESDPIRESYALLAFGLCDRVAGFPLSPPHRTPASKWRLS